MVLRPTAVTTWWAMFQVTRRRVTLRRYLAAQKMYSVV
jgi:hypothetical protein